MWREISLCSFDFLLCKYIWMWYVMYFCIICIVGIWETESIHFKIDFWHWLSFCVLLSLLTHQPASSHLPEIITDTPNIQQTNISSIVFSSVFFSSNIFTQIKVLARCDVLVLYKECTIYDNGNIGKLSALIPERHTTKGCWSVSCVILPCNRVIIEF